MPHGTTVYVIGVMFIATLVRSTFGFGEALIAVPLLALRLPVVVAAPLAVVASVLVAGLIVMKDYRKVQLRGAAGLVVSASLGIPVGLLLLATVDDRAVKAGLGLIIIAFSVYFLFARKTMHLHHDHWAWLLVCGFCSGVMGGAYGMNGPPLAVYGALRRWSPQQFRATLQAYFFPASLMGLLGYVVAGLWQPAVTRYSLLSLPAILAAVFIGGSLNQRLRGDRFFRLVYAALVIIGAVLLTQALTTR